MSLCEQHRQIVSVLDNFCVSCLIEEREQCRKERDTWYCQNLELHVEIDRLKRESLISGKKITILESQVFVMKEALERISNGENLPCYGDDDGSAIIIAKEALQQLEGTEEE